MTSVESLPFDILLYILDKEYISVSDLANISATSKFFNCVAKNNCLWWNKFKEYWPSIAEKYSSRDKNWKSLFKERYFYKNLVKNMLYELSRDCYHTRRISLADLKAFDDYTDQRSILFIIEELESIMKDSHRHYNLTEKFYSRRVLRYLRLVHIADAWAKAFASPLQEVSFVEVACLFSRWCKPFDTDFTPEVLEQIRDIAKLASTKLMEENPEHPALKNTVKEERLLNYSLWKTEQCLEVLKCINHVMFKDMKFVLVQCESLNFDDFFIEKVLSSKTGSVIIISIIYAAAAALLGVSCFPTLPQTSQTYLKLSVCAKEEVEDYTFIDIMYQGSFRNFQYLRDLFPSYPQEEWRDCIEKWCNTRDALAMCHKITTTLVYWNRLEHSNRSLCVLQGGKLHKCLKKKRYYFLDKSPEDVSFRDFLEMIDKSLSFINLPDVIPDIIHDRGYFPTEDFPSRQKLRYTSVYQIKYAVGMIMRHKEENYRCVIYSWDQKAEIMWSNFTYRQFYRHPNDRLRPHYRILVDDDSVCYASQASLEIDLSTEPIKNWRIGKFFESFHGLYYMPNEMTQSIYPEDVAAREQVLRQIEKDVIILDD